MALDDVAANTAAWYALQACRRHVERIQEPETRHLALRRLREHIDRWIEDTEVWAAPELEAGEAMLRVLNDPEAMLRVADRACERQLEQHPGADLV